MVNADLKTAFTYFNPSLKLSRATVNAVGGHICPSGLEFDTWCTVWLLLNRMSSCPVGFFRSRRCELLSTLRGRSHEFNFKTMQLFFFPLSFLIKVLNKELLSAVFVITLVSLVFWALWSVLCRKHFLNFKGVITEAVSLWFASGLNRGNCFSHSDMFSHSNSSWSSQRCVLKWRGSYNFVRSW